MTPALDPTPYPFHSALVEFLGEVPQHDDVFFPHPEPVKEPLALADLSTGLVLLKPLLWSLSLLILELNRKVLNSLLMRVGEYRVSVVFCMQTFVDIIYLFHWLSDCEWAGRNLAELA